MPLAGRLTQKERVLRALRTARGRGICATDFLAPDVIDNGKPILRVPARVDELRRDGHSIKIAGRRDECVIYVLTAPAEQWQPIAQEQAEEEAPTALFDTTVGKPPPSGPYDPDQDQAA